MLKPSSTDVLLVESDALHFVRFGNAKKQAQLIQARTLRLTDVFTDALVTPQLTNPAALSEALRRLRADAGSIDRVSLLLPDSWFRMNIVELNELPDKRDEAEETLRWAIKRSLPVPAEQLRMAHHVVGRTETKKRVLVVSAMQQTLVDIETALLHNGLWATTIEPLGLNIWNAVAAKTPSSTQDRLLIHVRNGEFTTALFRGDEPVFLRSRNLRGERSVSQEIRLSASYLRDNMGGRAIEQCFLAGTDADGELSRVLQEEFAAPVRRLVIRDFVEPAPGLELSSLEAEVIASTGVFAA